MVGSPVGTGVTGEAAPQASANSRGRVSSGRHFEAGGILKNVIFHQQIQADIIDKDLRSRLCRWQVFQLRFYSAGWQQGETPTASEFFKILQEEVTLVNRYPPSLNDDLQGIDSPS